MFATCALLFAAGCGSTSEISTPASVAKSNPLVAEYGTTAPAGANVVVEFGETTEYGRRTSAQPAPAGGGTVVVLVAGMKPSTTYHLRARITNSDGSTTLDSDRKFTTGAINAANFPVIKTFGNSGAGRGIELLNMPALPGQLPGDRVQSFATDLDGNIIWYYEHNAFEGSVFPAKLLPN